MADIRGCVFPDELSYDPDLNLWFRSVDDTCFDVGLTPFGHALSGDLYMFQPKPEGRDIESMRAFALVEAAKTVLPVRTPFAAKIVRTNPDPARKPALINRDPLGVWLVTLCPLQPEQAHTTLLRGTAVVERAHALMDLYRFESLQSAEKGRLA
jgi:glycine cleavage system H protein